MDKLHFTTGAAKSGFTRLDNEGDNELGWDFRDPLPLADHTVRMAHVSDYMEHIPRRDAAALYREIGRVLSPDGALRIETPDLRAIAAAYLAGNLEGGSDTPAQLLNAAMNDYYDESSLRGILHAAGFPDVVRCEGVEGRLIFEARLSAAS